MEVLYVYVDHFLNSPANIRTSVMLLVEICNWLNSPVFVCVTDTHNIRQTAGRTVKCQMSKWIYTAQFHIKHLNCAWFISISLTGSSSMCAKRRVALLAVGPRSSTGGKFQTFRPPTEKDHRPSVLRRYRGTIKRCRLADRRCRLGASTTGVQQLILGLCSPDIDSQLVLHADTRSGTLS